MICVLQTHFFSTNISTKPPGTHYILVRPNRMTLILYTRVFRADTESEIKLKLQKKHKGKQGRHFNVKLLQEDSTRTDFLGTFMKCFDTRYVEEGWKELIDREVCRQHLQCKKGSRRSR